jgi:two-component system nitrate/nitrite response regulator NarL
MIRLVIAEDHNSLIDGIRHFLGDVDDMKLVGTANNGHELCQVVQACKPDVVVTDIRMPLMDGIAATQEILKTNPSVKVVAFTMFDQDDAVQQMLELGACGYILKNSSLTELLKAIRVVYRGEKYFDPGIVLPGLQTARRATGPLSKRQIEILKLIAQGFTSQEIADTLFIGKTTVETHRKNMTKILNLKGTGELLRYAVESKYKF